MSATFLPNISFVIIMGKRDIMNLSVLSSTQNESNSDYNSKICQHLPLSLNQKLRHFNLLTQALPTKGNSNKNVKKKEHNADKREVLQTHAIQI